MVVNYPSSSFFKEEDIYDEVVSRFVVLITFELLAGNTALEYVSRAVFALTKVA